VFSTGILPFSRLVANTSPPHFPWPCPLFSRSSSELLFDIHVPFLANPYIFFFRCGPGALFCLLKKGTRITRTVPFSLWRDCPIVFSLNTAHFFLSLAPPPCLCPMENMSFVLLIFSLAPPLPRCLKISSFQEFVFFLSQRSPPFASLFVSISSRPRPIRHPFASHLLCSFFNPFASPCYVTASTQLPYHTLHLPEGKPRSLLCSLFSPPPSYRFYDCPHHYGLSIPPLLTSIPLSRGCRLPLHPNPHPVLP